MVILYSRLSWPLITLQRTTNILCHMISSALSNGKRLQQQ